jgi:perosamine synthetase
MNPRTLALLSVSNLKRLLRPSGRVPFPDVIGTFMGRDALALAIATLDLSPNDVVLLPAYLCGEVLRPFAARTQVEFYDVRPDLSVDPEALRLKLTERVKAALIINYFGFLQPFRLEIRRLCRDRGVVLIEDCAHSLLTEGTGLAGDISIYSFRKLLLVPDGGGLRMNGASQPVTPDFYPAIYANILSVLVVLRSLFDFRTDLLSRAWLSSRQTSISSTAQSLTSAQSPAPARPRTLPLSVFTANGLGQMPTSEIVAKRRADYQFWLDITEQSGELVPVFDTLPGGVCPLGVPVKVRHRDALKARLDANGIRTSIEWRLPVQVGHECDTSHELSRHLLTLPVYPILDVAQKRRAREILRAHFLANRS